MPEIAVPAGLELVDYSERWASATRDAKNESFADHWGSLPETEEHWNQRLGDPADGGLRTDASLLLISTDDSGHQEVVGFVLTSANESDWDRLGHSFGYIVLVGVRRSHRGSGAAQAMLSAVLHRYRELGWQRATLHVDTTSPTGADRLYRKLGFEPVAVELVYGRTF
jgi:ribosomal protein S18 acetylase RimI-like enzyme